MTISVEKIYIFLPYIMYTSRPPRHQNTLTWSTTRITVLEYCNKKYFFNYYPHALKPLDEKLWLDTLLLKNLKSLDMRVGEKTHHLLSDYLRLLKRQEVSTEEIQSLKDVVAKEMRDEYQLSKDRDYSLGYDREQKFGLSEHFYGESIDDQLEPMIQKVEHNLDVLLQSDRLDKIQHYFKTAKSVFVEHPRTKDFESMKLNMSSIPELKDINVMAAPDFGVVFADGKYLIIDWKSGQEKMDDAGPSDQLKIYALKLLLKGHINVEDTEITGYEVYLPSLNQIGGHIRKEDIDAIIAKLATDVEYQKQFLVDGDVVANEPLPHTSFPRTKSEKKCASCTFRKVCGELKAFE